MAVCDDSNLHRNGKLACALCVSLAEEPGEEGVDLKINIPSQWDRTWQTPSPSLVPLRHS